MKACMILISLRNKDTKSSFVLTTFQFKVQLIYKKSEKFQETILMFLVRQLN